ncbi:hypothetical protein K2173_015899 [Erythroxylum novogranatense]|uniref:Oxidative stress 3 n=1 Tax=Erythroxylum novogranatense TaxID=1862640 RepID=A0AAV8SEW3_9ROSI|nr:hypothetical protein K2173_015899 [Erythroxylum novogranatense]
MSSVSAGDEFLILDVSKKTISASGSQENKWVALEGGGSDVYESTSIESSSASSCSSDLVEDASSPTSSSSSSSSTYANGPLYDLSKLMSQLPAKRGLSKFYQGKSQSYTSLATVKSVEDLAKKVILHTPKMKSCKSYAGGWDGHNKSFSPRPAITKRASRGSFFYSSLGGNS